MMDGWMDALLICKEKCMKSSVNVVYLNCGLVKRKKNLTN